MAAGLIERMGERRGVFESTFDYAAGVSRAFTVTRDRLNQDGVVALGLLGVGGRVSVPR
jgi:hypothetical protein